MNRISLILYKKIYMNRIKIFIFSFILLLIMLLSLGVFCEIVNASEKMNFSDEQINPAISMYLGDASTFGDKITKYKIYTTDFVLSYFYEKAEGFDIYRIVQADVLSNKCYRIVDYILTSQDSYFAREIVEWDVSFTPRSYYYEPNQDPFKIPKNSNRTVIFFRGEDSYFSITFSGENTIYTAGRLDYSIMSPVSTHLEFGYDSEGKIHVFKNSKNNSLEQLTKFKSFVDQYYDLFEKHMHKHHLNVLDEYSKLSKLFTIDKIPEELNKPLNEITIEEWKRSHDAMKKKFNKILGL